MGSLSGWLYRMCEWITRLVYVNLLWIGFSLIGLLLFGIGPATSSMFTVIRKWVRGQEDINVFSTFRKTYKKDFWKANLLSFLLIVGGCLLYIDFLFIGQLEGAVMSLLSGLLLLLTMLYIVIVLYVFPVFVHFELKPWQSIKYAIHLGVSSPLSMLIIVASLLLMYYVTVYIPAIIPFFSGSIVSFIIMYRADISLRKLETKYIPT
ncbi:YesL family protein [Radiobacillus kanasensis]|uniref:YesL family protein n=1 Tax=Radiobacillus kanasensis TaxID=2844358 RepID=UPI001E4B034C|nr:YesL family protein [Radiobacillus kanasensis]UFU00623.1 YesL family protein [Radiobacillus kanasensis]